jgi:leucyl aminopeptidase
LRWGAEYGSRGLFAFAWGLMKLIQSTLELTTPLLAVPVFSDDQGRGVAFDTVDTQMGGRLTRIAEEESFTGKAGKTLLVHQDGAVGRILLVGFGPRADLKSTDLRKLGAQAVRHANDRNLTGAAALLPTDVSAAAAEVARFVAEGALLGAYRYVDFKTEDVEALTCEVFELAVSGSESLGPVLERAAAVAAGVGLARDLVNGPPIKVTPTYLGEVAEGIARDHGLDVLIHDKAAIEAAGMNLISAVSAGSDEEPRLIHLTYRPDGATDDTPSIALVGKGLTFDAGGYNLKPTGSIEDMKMDMAGGAAVLGAMRAVAELRPACVVHGIVPSSENLINGSAVKVADIIHSLNGKTVEIMNTDAEGRLILADALCYTERLGVDRIVDLATLTGACMVALGPYMAGLWSNTSEFETAIRDAAEYSGEELWSMPLNKRLRGMLKSPNADIKNIGKRWGGAITAALFLQEFVGETTWAHLDIAGPAFAEKQDELTRVGGTGFGVMTLCELVDRGV